MSCSTWSFSVDELDELGGENGGEGDGKEEKEYLRLSGPVLTGIGDEDVDPSSSSSFISPHQGSFSLSIPSFKFGIFLRG